LSGLQDQDAAQQAVAALTSAHRQISDLMRDTAPAAPRMLAGQGLIAALRAFAEGDGGNVDRIVWQVDPAASQAAAELPLFVNEVLFFAAQELIRNALRHGRGGDSARSLQVTVILDVADGLRLAVVDDGVGLGRPAALPDAGGNGLRFHSTMLAAVGGSLDIAAAPGQGTRATIRFPLDPG
jgi:signal transduction histidine kinase